MSDVWLDIKGMYPNVTSADIVKLTHGKVLKADLSSKRIQVSNMDDAMYILEHFNFSFVKYGMFIASLGANDLYRCRMIVVKNLKRQPLIEEKLYQHSKQFGVVCGIDVEGDMGRVWYVNEREAKGMVGGLEKSGLCTGAPDYDFFDNLPWIAPSNPGVMVVQPAECIVIDSDSDEDDDQPMVVQDIGLTTKALRAASSASSFSSLRENTGMQDQIKRNWNISRPDSFRKSVLVNQAAALRGNGSAVLHQKSNNNQTIQRHSTEGSGSAPSNGLRTNRRSRRHIALKSTGGRSPSPKCLIGDASMSGSLEFVPLLRELHLTEKNMIADGQDTETVSKKKKGKRTRKGKKGNDVATSMQAKEPVQSLDNHVNDNARDNINIEFRARAPFVYQFIHSHVPSEIESTGSHCLSMVWGPTKLRGKMDLFVSQGNAGSMKDMKYLCYNRDLSEDSRSTVVQYPFEIPKRFSAESALTPAHVFDLSETRPQYVAGDKENNSGPVASLKLYDEGRVMLGCSVYGVMVWNTDPIKHRQTLILIDDVSGVYDVGSNYIVTNSANGEMGVWKAGSANYIWRYNDTRKYRNLPSAGYELQTIITALKIAPNDTCTLIGNSKGALSLSDFREPYIQDLGMVKNDGISSIELIGDKQMLVGTQGGDIELYDIRYAQKDSKLTPIRSFSVPTANAANQIQVCPGSSRVFACASSKYVYIYSTQVGSHDPLPVFTHFGHQTTVSDFRWHPGQNYDYTIGSMETGCKGSHGLVQVWRPTNFVVNGW
ncbi:hypothetical protein FB645_002331 [Coemansia sp. IMI 203386]|nr:hypothetical protein FB645_002331 [Coemansia sp. IMI 203386]